MNSYGRTVIFIDNSNIFKNMNCIEQGYRIDWVKLIDWFSNRFNMEIWDQWFFVSEMDEPRHAQTKFHDMLREHGFHVRISFLKKKHIRCQECDAVRETYVEKGVDVAIATTILRLLYNNAFNTMILISGDSDLKEIIEEVKHNGRKAIVASYRDALASDLIGCANEIVYLDDIAEDIKLTRE